LEKTNEKTMKTKETVRILPDVDTDGVMGL